MEATLIQVEFQQYTTRLSLYDVRKWNDPFERLFILARNFRLGSIACLSVLAYFVADCAWRRKLCNRPTLTQH